MEIRVYGMFKYLRDRMLKTMVNNQKEIHKQVCIAEAINMLQNIVMSTLNGGVVVLIVLANSNRIRTVGTFVILFQITSQLFSVIQTLLGCYEQVKASQIQFKDFSKFMEFPVTKRPSVCYETNNKGIESHVDNVSFRYGDNQVDTLNYN
jgi:ABC-type bacteriocin/lantibiotic exporter with double-glycine peptidase domain